MTTFDLDRIGGHKALEALITEVLAAGELALDHYRGGAANRVEAKPDRSPVTVADQAVEERLRGYLERLFPTAAFLGEESGAKDSTSGLRFIVDPIDGTRAFIRGLDSWSVLLGLEADGEPVLGVAYMPVPRDLFVGVRGGGATMNGRPIRLSKVASVGDALVTHGGLQQFADDDRVDLLGRLATKTYTQRGYADFDGYRKVLTGQADAMVDPAIEAYDICPAAVLIREAGGRFTSLDGEESIHGKSGLASNGLIHDGLLELTRR